MYMCPQRLKITNKNKKQIPKLMIKQDAFGFGLSILEMGNLLTYRNIKLNKDQDLFDQ